MKPAQILVRRLASLLNIPDQAIRMLLATSEMSGLERKTLPRELIPLNAIQISRGVLNYIAFQGLHGWVFPYAFVHQLNPADPAFVPRAHLSVMMNVTHRNWTAIGNPECDIEPVVDPRGMITFAPNGWSLDIWIRCGGALVFPSRLDGVTQRLLEGNPIVETSFNHEGIGIVLTAFTEGDTTHCRVDIDRGTAPREPFEVIATVRPFNPEGVSLIHTLSYDFPGNTLRVNGRDSLRFSLVPGRIALSTFDEGDVAKQLDPGLPNTKPATVNCGVGLATGAVVFPFGEDEDHIQVTVSCRPGEADGGPWSTSDPPAIHSRWEEYRRGAMHVDTPDRDVNDLFHAALATLIQFTDAKTIAPGPFTYHQFWFRDAAAMLLALDKSGLARYADRVIRAFPDWQTRSGFFRSQQGEWDANGQALWSVWQHALYSAEGAKTAEHLFGSMRRGVRWIERSRISQGNGEDPGPDGLLPAGLSAEHLGLADYYYWDDFWALAGLRAYVAVCRMLGRAREASSAKDLLAQFGDSLDRALRSSEAMLGRKAIPAGPQRGLDTGMIGSLVAAYPLQVIAPHDDRITDSLEVITSCFFQGGMFFQDFVHSGLNTYLTMQIAHAHLYRGERQQAFTIFQGVLSRATTTFAFPEAIHPTTGGGTMGDGHHGWAAAEAVLFIREMFVYERWESEFLSYSLVLLAGVPQEWFEKALPFGLSDVPTPIGTLAIRVEPSASEVKLTMKLETRDHVQRCSCDVCYPFVIGEFSAVNESEREVNPRAEEMTLHMDLYGGQSIVFVRRGRNGVTSSIPVFDKEGHEL